MAICTPPVVLHKVYTSAILRKIIINFSVIGVQCSSWREVLKQFLALDFIEVFIKLSPDEIKDKHYFMSSKSIYLTNNLLFKMKRCNYVGSYVLQHLVALLNYKAMQKLQPEKLDEANQNISEMRQSISQLTENIERIQ